VPALLRLHGWIDTLRSGGAPEMPVFRQVVLTFSSPRQAIAVEGSGDVIPNGGRDTGLVEIRNDGAPKPALLHRVLIVVTDGCRLRPPLGPPRAPYPRGQATLRECSSGFVICPSRSVKQNAPRAHHVACAGSPSPSARSTRLLFFSRSVASVAYAAAMACRC
jgi:hypothetical protein